MTSCLDLQSHPCRLLVIFNIFDVLCHTFCLFSHTRRWLFFAATLNLNSPGTENVTVKCDFSHLYSLMFSWTVNVLNKNLGWKTTCDCGSFADMLPFTLVCRNIYQLSFSLQYMRRSLHVTLNLKGLLWLSTRQNVNISCEPSKLTDGTSTNPVIFSLLSHLSWADPRFSEDCCTLKMSSLTINVVEHLSFSSSVWRKPSKLANISKRQ